MSNDSQTTWDLGSGSGRKVEQKLLRKVLKVICDKKTSYPTEVAHHTSKDPGEIGSLLRELEDAGILERLKPKMKHSDDRLLKRSRDIQGGIKKFSQMNWYGLNSDLNWVLKDKNSGKYTDEYHETLLDQDPDIEENILDMAVNRMEEKA